MPKKYYNPQDDVFQIKDGKRMAVEAYNLYSEMHKNSKVGLKNTADNAAPSDANTPDNSAPSDANTLPADDSNSAAAEQPSVYFTFDGQHLTFIDNSGGGHEEIPIGAVSGRPNADGSFSYSKESQSEVGKGPIPEGTHLIDLATMRKTADRTFVDKLGAVSPIKIGKFPGGTNAWGEGRVDIQLDPKAPARTGITIHGGKTPGSAGCIDVVDKDKELFDIFENVARRQRQVPLIVDYSNTPAKVWWNGQKNKH